MSEFHFHIAWAAILAIGLMPFAICNLSSFVLVVQVLATLGCGCIDTRYGGDIPLGAFQHRHFNGITLVNLISIRVTCRYRTIRD